MLERYLEELKRISLLTPEEERALWKAYKDDGDMASRAHRAISASRIQRGDALAYPGGFAA